MKNKKLIVNGDDKYLNKLSCFKCGLNVQNNLVAYQIEENLDSISFKIFLDNEYKILFSNPGTHFINDILLAIKVGLECGVNIDNIIKQLGDFKIIDKRMNIKKLNKMILINDCYNSSYESLIAGINYLGKISGNKVAIIGDILELGKFSKKIHQKINQHLKKFRDIIVLTVGNYTKYIKGIHFDSNSELINYLKLNPLTDCYIYVKGSRKTNLDEIIEFLENN